MRELPELQVLADFFHSSYQGKVLNRIRIVNTKKIKDSQEDFDKTLKSKILKSVYRFGKALHFQFANNEVLGIDLKLHGNLALFDKINDNKSTVAELYFDQEKGVALTDWQGKAVMELHPDTTHGVDALAKELYSYLLTKLQSKVRIKGFITNQKLIRGIGDVYADEILWEAAISPFSISSAIPEFKIKALVNAIQKVLTDAEKQLISKKIVFLSYDSYDFLKIHGRAGEKSPSGSIIKVEKKGGHSTYFTEEQVLYK